MRERSLSLRSLRTGLVTAGGLLALVLSACDGTGETLPPVQPDLATATESPAFTVQRKDAAQTVRLAELQKALRQETLSVQSDLVYRKDKTYEGFWLADVLRHIGLDERSTDGIVLTASDGYRVYFPFSVLKEWEAAGIRPFLAIRDVAGPEGIPKGGKLYYPGPFWLVFQRPLTGKEQTLWQWIYQITTFEPLDMKAFRQRLRPAAADTDPSVASGAELYRAKCLTCHSLNLEGGTVGSELNVPQNITEYRSDDFLRKWLKDPASFRARAKMPNLMLTDPEITDLLGYLKAMAGLKQGPV